MSYDSTTDFLGLLRLAGGGVQSERMPGLDYVVAALSRMGFINLFVGQSAPTTNQVTTVWLQPASPSWSAEGTVWLWSTVTESYEVATPALWVALLDVTLFVSYVFQSVTVPAAAIGVGVSLCAVVRVAPAATALTLPSLTLQAAAGKKLQIVDFSTGVTAHDITLTPSGTSTIMQKGQLVLSSTADQLSGVTLTPSPELDAWVITP